MNTEKIVIKTNLSKQSIDSGFLQSNSFIKYIIRLDQEQHSVNKNTFNVFAARCLLHLGTQCLLRANRICCFLGKNSPPVTRFISVSPRAAIPGDLVT
jgi:hypothetical protein